MCTLNNQLQNFTVQCYAASNSGANVGTPQTAPFGTFIAVQVTCTYSPITPAFLRLGQTVNINVKIMMCSEAN
jgi:hypothetical protein